MNLLESVNSRQIIKLLNDLNFSHYDRYVIHSSIFKFGLVIGGIKTFLEILIKMARPGTVFAFPAFTLVDNKKPFEAKSSFDSANGSLSKYIFHNKNFFRTKSLMHSYIIIGKVDFKDIVCDRIDASFGNGTIFEHFERENFRWLLLGCNFQQGASFVHHVEQKCLVPYRKKIILKKKRVLNNGKEEIVNYNYFARISNDYNLNLQQFQIDCIKKGFSLFSSLNGALNYSICLKNSSNYLNKQLHLNPLYLLSK